MAHRQADLASRNDALRVLNLRNASDHAALEAFRDAVQETALHLERDLEVTGLVDIIKRWIRPVREIALRT